MGLDMYLNGETFNWSDWEKPEGQRRPMRDGFEITGQKLQIGCWRKHPNLHGYIVKNFASGVDECQRIDLSREDMKDIIEAIKEKRLPETKGFFFGESDGSEDEESIQIFEKAIEWVSTIVCNESRNVYYEASW